MEEIWESKKKKKISGPGGRAGWRQLKRIGHPYYSHDTIHSWSYGPEILWSCWRLSPVLLAGLTIQYQPKLSSSLVICSCQDRCSPGNKEHFLHTINEAPSMYLKSDLEGLPLGLTKLHQMEMLKSYFPVLCDYMRFSGAWFSSPRVKSNWV